MRRLLTRGMAVLAIVAGIGAGASALPANAAAPSQVHVVHTQSVADWWW
jgi:hypothetical protein